MRCHGMETVSDECLDGTPCHKPSCSTPDVDSEPFAPSSLHVSDLRGVSVLANVNITTRNLHSHCNMFILIKLMYLVYFLLKQETQIPISEEMHYMESVYSCKVIS